MIYLKIFGGLGNQMFQLAFATALAEKYKSNISLEISSVSGKDLPAVGHIPRNYELSVFSPKHSIIDKYELKKRINKGSQWIRRLFLGFPEIAIIKEESFGYHPQFFNHQPPVYLEGYFQSEKYFSAQADIIRQVFHFPSLDIFRKEEWHLSASHYFQMIKNAENPISVHFRRGDFVTDPQFNRDHGVCSLDYYKQAFQFYKEKYPYATFFIFSDDIETVERELADFNIEKVFIKHHFAIPNWLDMMLMSQCKHHIIANSSYSWWGAWLSNHESKEVIAPQKWFAGHHFSSKDIIPESWIKF